MELLDRYLQSVKWWLPNKEKEDVVAELADDIRSEMDELEAELGREPNDAEVASILKRRGHPMLVAARFLPQGYLIGPVLFPIYEKVLKGVGLFYVGPWILVWIAMMIASPSFRASREGIQLIGDFINLVEIVIWAFAIITVVFAVVQRTQAKLLADWNPRRLPRVRDPKRVPRSSSIADLIGNFVALAWWLALPKVFAGNLLSGGVWDDFQRLFYIPVLLIVIVGMVLAAIDVARPYRTRLRHSLRALMNAASATMASIVVVMHRVAFEAEVDKIVMHTLRVSEAKVIAVDMAVFVTLGFIATFCIPTAAVDAYRAARHPERSEGPQNIGVAP